MNIIEIKNVTYTYPGNIEPVLKDITMSITPGEFVGIVGGNGSGKSTLLKLILGLYKPNKGTVRMWNEPPAKKVHQVGYVSQYEYIDFHFPITMFELVQMGLISGKIINNFTKKDNLKVQAIMEELDIWKLRNELIRNVSGGQKQRGFLARALISDPELLILDEPLANLDIKLQHGLFELLKTLHEKKKTIIVVDHNLDMLTEYCTKIICVDKCEPHTLKVHSDNLEMLLHNHGHS